MYKQMTIMRKYIYKWAGLCAVMLCLWTGAACLTGCQYPDDDFEYIEEGMMPEVGEVSASISMGSIKLSASYSNPGNYEIVETGFYIYYKESEWSSLSSSVKDTRLGTITNGTEFSLEYWMSTLDTSEDYLDFQAYIKMENGLEITGPVLEYGQLLNEATVGSVLENLEMAFSAGYVTIGTAFALSWDQSLISSMEIQYCESASDTWYILKTYDAPEEDGIYAGAVTDLNSNTRYYFRVALRTLSGLIYYSSGIDNYARTLDLNTVDITATPSYTSFTAEMDMDWSLDTPFTKLELQYQESGTSLWTTFATFDEAQDSYSGTATGLKQDTRYYIRARITSVFGYLDYTSETRNYVRTNKFSVSDMNLRLTPDFNSVTVDFDMPPVSEFPYKKVEIQYRKSSSSSWTVGATYNTPQESYSKTVTGLEMGISYYFRVAVTKSDGEVMTTDYKYVSTLSESFSDYNSDWDIVDNSGNFSITYAPTSCRLKGVKSATFYIYPSGSSETSSSALSCTATYSSSTNTFTGQRRVNLTGYLYVKIIVKSTSGESYYAYTTLYR